MRVTQFTFYNNFLINQENDLSALSKVQTQLASGKKIEYMYDDPVVFVRDLKFQEEINSFTQIKNSAQFAKTFANETDTVLNDISNTLDSFKTKLLQAANDTNNDTSRMAIAKELEGELNHLRDLANTSLDGKYIFSGSAFDKKPIDDNFKYQGNDKNVKAFLGAGVEREYNITGSELFLGRDDDYKKHVTLNIIQYDKMKANPEFVVRGRDGKLYIDKNITKHGKIPDSEDPAVNEPISGDSEIRRLTGVSDIYDSTNDTYYDGLNTFFIQGRKPDGEMISTKIYLKNSDSVNDLLEKIGEAFGNTSTSKVVDVYLNSDGEIQIKSLQDNKMITDFFMVSTGDDLKISALKTNGDSVNENDTIADSDTTFSVEANGVSYSMSVSGGESVKEFIDDINNGKLQDSSGNSLNIKADLVNGKIILHRLNSDTDITSIDDSGLNVDFNIKNINSPLDLTKGDYAVKFQKSNLNSIRNEDTITANNQYFDNRIFKFTSTFKLIDNSREAVNEDKIQNVIGINAIRSSDGSIQTIATLHLSGTDTNGNAVSDDLTIDSTTTMQDLIDKIKNDFGDVDVSLEDGKLIIKDNTISSTEDSKLSISIQAQDSDGNALQCFRSDDLANFNELFMDKNSNEITSNVSQIVKDKKIYYKDGEEIIENNALAQTYANDDTTVADTIGDDTFPKTINIRFRDKNGEFKVAKIVLDDGDSDGDGKSGSYFEIDGNKYYIYDSNGNTTPAHDKITTTTTIDPTTCEACQKEILQKGVTFSQLEDVLSMLVSDNLPANDDADDYKKALLAAKEEIDTKMDEKGRLTLKDKNNSPSKIDISMYADDNSISFEENNAITIDEPQIDFFDTLQKAIEAVKNGENYANGDSDDPRNFGIQGAIEAIDHVMDRVRRVHAKIGAISQEFDMSISRVDMLKNHITILQSENIDTDIGKATMQLNSIQTSYQALLASIAKINNLTLLNYLR